LFSPTDFQPSRAAILPSDAAILDSPPPLHRSRGAISSLRDVILMISPAGRREKTASSFRSRPSRLGSPHPELAARHPGLGGPESPGRRPPPPGDKSPGYEQRPLKGT